jgi:hypothetical protein
VAFLSVFLAGAAARATPGDGAVLSAIEVEDTDGGRRRLPDAAHPVAIIYEDQDASKRPQPARELFGTYTRRAENRAVFEFVAVADVSKWNWWPAKKYVFADIKKIATKNNTKVFLDWTGAVRKAWGLKKGASGVLLLGVDGRVKFACEGPLADAQGMALVAAVAARGGRGDGS